MSYKNYNIEGKLNDRFEDYYENGRLFQRGTYKNGKKHGLWIQQLANTVLCLNELTSK